jgi:Cdc6-like AAA superfamily ATPase|tara:strand:+ start:4797 stop:5393 length:597 start_codon:yes stop_codon:yes gene_type:complete
MSQPSILKIAISGKMGSGKTTLANEILHQFNSGYSGQSTMVSLGAAVKEVARNYFLMPDDVKDRSLLQQIGQQFRTIKENVWVDIMLIDVQGMADSTSIELCICDDVRFENELELLQADGWMTIRLTVDESEQKRRLECAYADNWRTHWEHRNEISETELDNTEGFDLTLHNLGLEDVPHNASEILELITSEIWLPQP